MPVPKLKIKLGNRETGATASMLPSIKIKLGQKPALVSDIKQESFSSTVKEEDHLEGLITAVDPKEQLTEGAMKLQEKTAVAVKEELDIECTGESTVVGFFFPSLIPHFSSGFSKWHLV